MFLEVDFINVFHDFHAKGIFEKGFNATFITLIPKILVIDIKDFPPISLSGGIYEIVAKVLVNRLNGSGEDHF